MPKFCISVEKPDSFCFPCLAKPKICQSVNRPSNFVSMFCAKEKVSKPEFISSKANVLWPFLFAKVKGCISIRLMYSGFFLFAPFQNDI